MIKLNLQLVVIRMINRIHNFLLKLKLNSKPIIKINFEDAFLNTSFSEKNEIVCINPKLVLIQIYFNYGF